MTDWEHLRHFAALARTGTLSAAARLLGVEHATIARRIAALEGETGLKLVDRRGRRLSLTEEGARIAAIARRMETEALAVARAVRGQLAELAGEVSLSAPPALAAARLTAALVALRTRHPALRLHLRGEIRQASLGRREADIAIRLSRPVESGLTVSKLGEMAFGLYAAPAYLAATAPSAWAFIAYDADMDDAPQQAMLRRVAQGRPIVIRASTAEIQLAAARAGGGVVMLPAFMAAGDPGLVAAMPGEVSLTRDIWLAVHSDLKDTPAIRAVIDALRAAMRDGAS